MKKNQPEKMKMLDIIIKNGNHEYTVVAGSCDNEKIEYLKSQIEMVCRGFTDAIKVQAIDNTFILPANIMINSVVIIKEYDA